MADDAPLIDDDMAAFMERGISVNLGSCGPDLRPSVARALGARVAADRRSVRVLVARAQAAEVLAHLRATGRVAAVFSEPPTHRTIQFKAEDARVEPAADTDIATVRRYRHEFVRCLAQLGYQPDLMYAFLHCADSDIAAVVFTPTSAFVQTPGPQAGQKLEGRP
ncbi:MAG: hypothetical protein ACXU8N_21015 [Telluria sp.]